MKEEVQKEPVWKWDKDGTGASKKQLKMDEQDNKTYLKEWRGKKDWETKYGIKKFDKRDYWELKRFNKDPNQNHYHPHEIPKMEYVDGAKPFEMNPEERKKYEKD